LVFVSQYFINCIGCTESNGSTIHWAECGRKQSWPIVRYLSEEAEKINKNTTIRIDDLMFQVRNGKDRHGSPAGFRRWGTARY
jgi:hypothetical protein